jgi:hypothetical protein
MYVAVGNDPILCGRYGVYFDGDCERPAAVARCLKGPIDKRKLCLNQSVSTWDPRDGSRSMKVARLNGVCDERRLCKRVHRAPTPAKDAFPERVTLPHTNPTPSSPPTWSTAQSRSKAAHGNKVQSPCAQSQLLGTTKRVLIVDIPDIGSPDHDDKLAIFPATFTWHETFEAESEKKERRSES